MKKMDKDKPTPARRIWTFRTIAVLSGLFLVCIVGEIFLRIFPVFTADRAARPPLNYRAPDAVFGWLVKPNYLHDGELRDLKGVAYPLHVSFEKKGFRHHGDPSSGRKKVLFIGDSYTACAQTSDGKVWPKLLGDSLGIEIFVYGAAGYGSTQEAMVAARFLPEIKPDLVVWQFCSNDFLDNYWELEKIAGYHVRMRRPYFLENGELVYETAAEFPRNLKAYSHFAYFVLKVVMLAGGTFNKPPAEQAEKIIAEQNERSPLFAKSMALTAAAMQKMRAALPPGTKIIAFDADHFEPQYGQIARLCRENGIEFVEGVAQSLVAAEQRGECVRTDDGYHWNDRGNAIGAAFLRPVISEKLHAVPKNPGK